MSVDIERGRKILQMGWLPSTPIGHLEWIAEALEEGWITPADAIRLGELPALDPAPFGLNREFQWDRLPPIADDDWEPDYDA